MSLVGWILRSTDVVVYDGLERFLKITRKFRPEFDSKMGILEILN